METSAATQQQSAENGEARGLAGFITERHLAQAEEEFPGITEFYRSCVPCPRTFLGLVGRFLDLH